MRFNKVSKLQWQLWGRSLLWLAFLAPFFFLTYGQVNQYTATLNDVPSIFFDWEKHIIPFWPWTIVPYWSIDLLYGISLFICTSKRELNVHVLRLVIASLTACIGFLLFPLKFSFVRPVSDGLFGWLFIQLEQFDLPFNQAPSLHIILLWLLWLRFYPHTPNRWRWLLHSWFALIGLSVLTTWQHHFIDVVSGFAVGVLISYLLPVNFKWHWYHIKDKRRLTLTKRYLFGSLVCLGLACFTGGFGWLLLWPAFALFMVALGYTGLGTTVFQKNGQGKMTLSARILLAPYQVVAKCMFLFNRRKNPLIDKITENIYLGSFPCQHHNVNAILDMTADWPKPAVARHYQYIACPRLDLVAPTVSELHESVEALSTLLKTGSVFVHCALGLSRSAIVIIAWLLKEGEVSSPEEAIEFVKKARPGIVIYQEHKDILNDWYQHYIKGNVYA